MTETMLERVGAAIFRQTGPKGFHSTHGNWNDLGSEGREIYTGLARAALEALLEPTIDMCAAGRAVGDDYAAGDVWRAMIRAAQEGA